MKRWEPATWIGILNVGFSATTAIIMATGYWLTRQDVWHGAKSLDWLQFVVFWSWLVLTPVAGGTALILGRKARRSRVINGSVLIVWLGVALWLTTLTMS